MELFTGLIVGFIIGWSLNWAIQPLLARMGRGDSVQDLENTLTDLEVRLQALESASNSRAPRVLTVKSGEQRMAQVFVTDRDPLEEIHGIGPVFAERLNEAGIYTFEELAHMTPVDLEALIEPQYWQGIDPQAWIREAARRSRQPSPDPAGDRS